MSGSESESPAEEDPPKARGFFSGATGRDKRRRRHDNDDGDWRRPRAEDGEMEAEEEGASPSPRCFGCAFEGAWRNIS